MQKEEIIQLHTLFAKIKDDIEKEHPESKDIFKEYDQFGVFPNHLHRSKSEHKRALSILMGEIEKLLRK